MSIREFHELAGLLCAVTAGRCIDVWFLDGLAIPAAGLEAP
jgi:hypothetical protein